LPRIHQQSLPDLTNVETYALSPDTRKILEGMGHKFGPPQPASHLALIIVGAPSLGSLSAKSLSVRRLTPFATKS
jgi:gamma-glutamyltranspeptidase / glutathione hydrolase